MADRLADRDILHGNVDQDLRFSIYTYGFPVDIGTFFISMAIGQKTWAGEGFSHDYYLCSGQNKLLRLIGFRHVDYRGIGTHNCELESFLPWLYYGSWS